MLFLSPMQVLTSVVVLSVLNLCTSSASASYILIRQDTSDCTTICHPTQVGGSDQTTYNNQLCKQQGLLFSVLSCLQGLCSGNGLVGAVNDLKSRCNSVGVDLNISMNTPTNALIPTPTTTPPPTSAATSRDTSTTSSTTTLTPSTNTSPSSTVTSLANTSTSSSTSPPDPSSPPSSGGDSSVNTGLIVGGVVGLIVALAILICSIIMYRRRTRTPHKRSPSSASNYSSLTTRPLLQKFSGRDGESVEKLRLHDSETTSDSRGRSRSAGAQQESDIRSETHGSHTSSIGHWGGSSESGVHQPGENKDPAPDYDVGLTRRPTDCGYEPNTRRPDIGVVLKSVFSSSPPVYGEGQGLLNGGSSAGHGR